MKMQRFAVVAVPLSLIASVASLTLMASASAGRACRSLCASDVRCRSRRRPGVANCFSNWLLASMAL